VHYELVKAYKSFRVHSVCELACHHKALLQLLITWIEAHYEYIDINSSLHCEKVLRLCKMLLT